MIRIIMLSILFGVFIIFYSCIAGGKYYSMEDISPQKVNFAHYIYKDDNLTLAAKIRSGGIMGHFWYDLLIINNGNKPISMNWVYDVLSMKKEEKIYQLEKLTPITSYPNVLNPESYVNIGFNVESRFNQSINEINSLIFQFNDKNYILNKNSSANWE